jgi:TonB family protein
VQKCNEFGTVVVQITVNRSGNVIAAKYTKGTTNTNPCLVEPALATARKYKWQSDANAPKTQIGFITVNFKLGE